MFSATKWTPFSPTQINGNVNDNNPFWRRRAQEPMPTTPAVSSPTSSQPTINAIGGPSTSIFPLLQPRSQDSASILGLDHNAWRSVPPASSTSSSRRPAHSTSRASINPYQTLDAKGRKKLHKMRQKISRAVEDKGLIPFALHLVNIQSSKSVARSFAEAVNRKAEKLKQKIAPRTLYRGPKLNWMEIGALKRKTDEEEGKAVDGGNETGVSNLGEILQQNWQRSYHVPQVVMPSVHKQSDGDANDGDTDPGTDTDIEGDTDVEEDKENIDPGEGVEVAAQVADHTPASMTSSPARPPDPTTTRDPPADRTTVVEVPDEELLETPGPARTRTPSAPGNIPGALSFRGEHMLPTVQNWHGPLGTESAVGGPFVMASQTLPNAQNSLPPIVSEIRPAFRVEETLQQPLPSLSGADSHQGQQANELSQGTPSISNGQQQQTPAHETQTNFGIPINSEPLHTFVPTSGEWQHIPGSRPSDSICSDAPGTHSTSQQQKLQSAFLGAQSTMQQPQFLSSGNTVNPADHRPPHSSHHSASHHPPPYQPSHYASSFRNVDFTLQNEFSQPGVTFAEMNNGSAFPPLHATFRFLNTVPPQPQYTSSQRIIRRLPVLAKDEPPNRPILFGPHGIQAFLKEKHIPSDDPTPLPDPRKIVMDCDSQAWYAKRKRLLDEFEKKKRKRPGPLDYRSMLVQPKKNYVGHPPKGSEEDLIRRLEHEKRFNKLKTQKRVRFLLPEEPPRKKRRTEETDPSLSSGPRLEPNPFQVDNAADPAMPGAYNIQFDCDCTTKITGKRRFPGITSLFSFLLGRPSESSEEVAEHRQDTAPV